jgi:signal transduction histidine kinase
MPNIRGMSFFGKNQRLSRRFFALVLICSFSALSISTGLELWLEYRSGLQRIESNLELIRDSYLPAIETSLYAVDELQLRLLLKGILKLEGIVGCQVREESAAGGLRISEGSAGLAKDGERTFPLVYLNRSGETIPIGTLAVYTDPSKIFDHFWELVSIQVTVFAIMILLSAGLIMGSFQRLVARHLSRMAEFARGIDIEHLESTLLLRRAARDDELGQVAGALNSMQARLKQDMTLRQRWEETLKSERDLHARVMETSPAGIVRVDVHGRLVYANKRAEEILDVHLAKEAARTYDAPEWKITGLHGEPFPKEKLPFFIIKQTHRAVFDVQHAIEWPNRRRVLLSVNAAPLYDPQGALEGMVAAIDDITERKRAEEALLHQKQEQEKMEERYREIQKMEAIGNLAGGIAHDFNNILTPIVGLADLLREDFPPGSAAHESAQQILAAGKRGKELVDQILAFSRQSKNKPIPVRIQQVVHEVLKLGRATIPSNIAIVPEIDKACGLVMADATQIHQVVMNLITNAFHAIEPANGTITVQLEEVDIGDNESRGNALLTGRYARLTVADTGCGIAPSVIDKIFDPYFTTKAQGKGTGLGLAVVYGIVKGFDGDIKVSSEVGKGTTFDVYFPIMEKVVETAADGPVEKDKTGNERILLVDDEPAIAQLEKIILERLGYRVTSLISSLDALAAFRTHPEAFDLVISDMTMPNMTGDQLAKALMAIKPEIPIIICTGFSERIDPKRATANGIKALLMKPVVKSELARLVRLVLDEGKG